MGKPVYIGCSSHIFCSDCIADLLQHNPTTNNQFPCPCCRKQCNSQSINRLLIIDRRMDQLLVKCPNHEITTKKAQILRHIKTERNNNRNYRQSHNVAPNQLRSRSRSRSRDNLKHENETKLCEWIGEWVKLNKHISVCTEHPIKCKHCGIWMIRREQNKHYRECKMFPIQCQQCKQIGIPRKNMMNHLNNECLLGKEKCIKCETMIIRKNMSLHRSTCPEIAIFCDYHSFGCRWKIKRKKMNDHNQECMQMHLSLVKI